MSDLGYDMAVNTARGFITHLIKPVVNDVEWAQIIVANKNFYIGIMGHCREMSQNILNRMKTNTNVKAIYSTVATDID